MARGRKTKGALVPLASCQPRRLLPPSPFSPLLSSSLLDALGPLNPLLSFSSGWYVPQDKERGWTERNKQRAGHNKKDGGGGVVVH